MFRTNSRFISLVWALLLVCASSVAVGAQDASPVRIGSLMSLTGDLAAYGGPIGNGVQLAAEHVNNQGGILGGRRLEVVQVDDQTNPQIGVTAASTLVNLHQVPAFVGALASSVTLSVANAIAIPNQVVQISPASTAPELTYLDDHGFVFRTTPADTLQGIVLGQVTREAGFDRVAVIYINNEYGQGLRDSFSRAFTEQGGVITGSVAYTAGAASYRAELQQVSRGNPQALMVVAYPDRGGNLIVRQALEEGFFREFLFTDGMKSLTLVEGIGAEILEGTLGTAAEALPDSPSGDLFRRYYAARYGELPPQPYIDAAYDAAFVIAMAIERAGQATGPAIRDAIASVTDPNGDLVMTGEWAKAKELIAAGRSIRYEGAAGPILFDEAGDMAAGAIGVWKITNGDIVTERVVVLQ